MRTITRWLLFVLSQVCWFGFFVMSPVDFDPWPLLWIIPGFIAYIVATRTAGGPFAYVYSFGEPPDPPLDIFIHPIPAFLVAWMLNWIAWLPSILTQFANF